jgi:hypothetical protein
MLYIMEKQDWLNFIFKAQAGELAPLLIDASIFNKIEVCYFNILIHH